MDQWNPVPKFFSQDQKLIFHLHPLWRGYMIIFHLGLDSLVSLCQDPIMYPNTYTHLDIAGLKPRQLTATLCTTPWSLGDKSVRHHQCLKRHHQSQQQQQQQQKSEKWSHLISLRVLNLSLPWARLSRYCRSVSVSRSRSLFSSRSARRDWKSLKPRG